MDKPLTIAQIKERASTIADSPACSVEVKTTALIAFALADIAHGLNRIQHALDRIAGRI